MRDHREIGQQLDLFTFHEWSPGCPIWLPKGTLIYNILQEKMRVFMRANRYHEVKTPQIWKSDLYKKSGHLDHYCQNMFGFKKLDPLQPPGKIEVAVEEYFLKPMNCPGHMALFASRHWSYRDLPYRMYETTTLHRDEPTGSLGGLTRTRAFCQDDAHIFLAPEQVQQEVRELIGMVMRVYLASHVSPPDVFLSTRPEKYMGEPGQWDEAETALKAELDRRGVKYVIAPGDGAFYGPKIDFVVTGQGDRKWQTATIQLDFQLPERFGLKYQAADNTEKRPVVIHRALYGSFERFIAMLLEQSDGYLPVWLSPVQAAVLSITDENVPYCQSVHNSLAVSYGWRAELMTGNGETLNAKIRRAEERRIPYILVCGKKEADGGLVNVRKVGSEEKLLMTVEQFVSDRRGEQNLEF